MRLKKHPTGKNYKILFPVGCFLRYNSGCNKAKIKKENHHALKNVYNSYAFGDFYDKLFFSSDEVFQ